MRERMPVRISSAVAVAASVLAVVFAGSVPARAEANVLRIGWAKDPGTLNPFTALDFEPYFVWALNWQFPIGYSPLDNAPAPSIVKDWRTSADGRTTTYRLVPGLRWSDGQPLTSADVAFTLETLGTRGLLFGTYSSNVTSVQTPDSTTMVVRSRVPDVRLTDDLFLYVLPRHIWGRVPPAELTTSYQPRLPLVGSGPYVTTEFRRGRILRLERNPHFHGPKPAFEEVQFVRYGTEDAVQRALRLGEIDLVPGLGPTTYSSLEGADDVTRNRGVSSQFTQITFNLCPASVCPDAHVNRAIQDIAVRRALAFAVDRERIVDIATRGTSEPGQGILSPFYRRWYRTPRTRYGFDPKRAERILDAAGYRPGPDGVRERGDRRLSFRLYARVEDPFNQQAARLVAEQARQVGIEFEVQLLGGDKLIELVFQSKGKAPAPDFDASIYDWQGDPYDPSFVLALLTTSELGRSNDAHYVNPAYDRLFAEQLSELDQRRRADVMARMVEIAQRDLPYLVLSYDASLQAYRSDRIAELEPAYPADGGSLLTPAGVDNLLAARPASGGGGGGGSSGLWLVVATGVLALLVGWVLLRRRRRDQPSELEV